MLATFNNENTLCFAPRGKYLLIAMEPVLAMEHVQQLNSLHCGRSLNIHCLTQAFRV